MTFYSVQISVFKPESVWCISTTVIIISRDDIVHLANEFYFIFSNFSLECKKMYMQSWHKFYHFFRSSTEKDSFNICSDKVHLKK